jgi:hypothetical protein
MCEDICKDNRCDDDMKCDNDKNENADKKVNEFVKSFHTHGIGCGTEIAEIAKEIHPDALAIVPLYRSCIVIEQSDEEKKDGMCTIHSYADPHWMDGDIDADTLKSDDFHFEFVVQGDRQGPTILKKHCPENVNVEDIGDQHHEDDYPKVLEHDEN